MYHSTPHGKAQSKWDVTLKNFKAQLQLLKVAGWQAQLISKVSQPMPAQTVFITFDDGFQDNYPAFEALKDSGFVATWFIVSDTVGKQSHWESNIDGQRNMLDSGQLRELLQAGMEIGSHTCSHANLNALTEADVYEELSRSKSELESVTQSPISSLAYPYGSYSIRTRDIAELIGYKQACTTSSGFGLIDDDPLQIRRISIYAHDTLATFARKIVFGDNEVGLAKTFQYLSRRLKDRLR